MFLLNSQIKISHQLIKEWNITQYKEKGNHEINRKIGGLGIILKQGD